MLSGLLIRHSHHNLLPSALANVKYLKSLWDGLKSDTANQLVCHRLYDANSQELFKLRDICGNVVVHLCSPDIATGASNNTQLYSIQLNTSNACDW